MKMKQNGGLMPSCPSIRTKASKRSGNPMKNGLSILSYSDALCVPRSYSVPFISLVKKWIGSCGLEDTVTRLKAIKLDLIRSHAGLPMIAPYVARNRSNTRFRGPLKAIQNWSKLKDRNFVRAVQFLNMYSLFYSPVVTHAQECKFLAGVQAENPPIPDDIKDGLKQASLCIRPCKKLPDPVSIVDLPISPGKKEPLIDGSSVPEGTETLEVAAAWYNHFYSHTLSGEPYDPKLNGLLGLLDKIFRDLDGGWGYWPKVDLTMGKIGFIQEPGFKLRAVANPSRILQAALKPMGKYLFDQLRSLPWDCTFNQEKAIPFIQNHLRSGGQVFSVDLTDASSFFPLELQECVLMNIFPNDLNYIDAFLFASRSPWSYGKPEDGKRIAWSRGQPLGLYPSFASAFLTHGLLLLYLNNYSHKDDFFVLGDDVIILKEELYLKYRKCLAELHCPVSESKTLSSFSVAEFAGKVITKTLAFNQFKWKNPSDDSFIDIVRNIGQRALRLLKRRQRYIAEIMLEVPDFMGGIGLNPKGIPLSVRVERALSILREGCGDSYIMSYNGLVNKLLYQESFWTEFFVPLVPDFDKKSRSYVLQFLGRFVNLYETLGFNLATVNPDLPLQMANSTAHPSLLEILERKIR